MFEVIPVLDKQLESNGTFTNCKVFVTVHTGQVFSKGNKITLKIHIRQFEEQMASGRVPSGDHF